MARWRTFALILTACDFSEAAPFFTNTTKLTTPVTQTNFDNSTAILTGAPIASTLAPNASAPSNVPTNRTRVAEIYEQLWSHFISDTTTSTSSSTLEGAFTSTIPSGSVNTRLLMISPGSRTSTYTSGSVITSTEWYEETARPIATLPPQPGGNCDQYCIEETLALVAESAAADGIEDAVSAYDALEWINANYTSFNSSSNSTRTTSMSFKEDMMNVIPNIANNVLSNYMVDMEYCDDACLARSMEAVASRSSLAAIRWCLFLFNKAGLQPVDAEQFATMMRVYMVLSDTHHLWLPIDENETQEPQGNLSRQCHTSSTTAGLETETTSSIRPPVSLGAAHTRPTWSDPVLQSPTLMFNGGVVPTPTTAKNVLEELIPEHLRSPVLLDELIEADRCTEVPTKTLIARQALASYVAYYPTSWNRGRFMSYLREAQPRLHGLLWDLYNVPPAPWPERYDSFHHRLQPLLATVGVFLPVGAVAQAQLFLEPPLRETALTESGEIYYESEAALKDAQGRPIVPNSEIPPLNPDAEHGDSFESTESQRGNLGLDAAQGDATADYRGPGSRVEYDRYGRAVHYDPNGRRVFFDAYNRPAYFDAHGRAVYYSDYIRPAYYGNYENFADPYRPPHHAGPGWNLDAEFANSEVSSDGVHVDPQWQLQRGPQETFDESTISDEMTVEEMFPKQKIPEFISADEVMSGEVVQDASIPDMTEGIAFSEEWAGIRDQRPSAGWYEDSGMHYRDLYRHPRYTAYDQSSRPLEKTPSMVEDWIAELRPSTQGSEHSPEWWNVYHEWGDPLAGDTPLPKQQWIELRTEEELLENKLGKGVRDPVRWQSLYKQLAGVHRDLKNFETEVLRPYYGRGNAAAVSYAREFADIYKLTSAHDVMWEHRADSVREKYLARFEEYKDFEKAVEATKQRLESPDAIKRFDNPYTDPDGLQRLGMKPFDSEITVRQETRAGEYVSREGGRRVYPIGEGSEWEKGGFRYRAAKWAGELGAEEDASLVARILRWFLRIFKFV